MSRFYVGQRVRIVGALASKFLIGRETVVKALDSPGWYKGGAYRGILTAETNIVGNPFVALPEQLEPLTDPGREVLSWSDERCVWRPDREVVR